MGSLTLYGDKGVAIFGAGLSGLVAARQSLNGGVWNVTLFEVEANHHGVRQFSQCFDDTMLSISQKWV